MPAAKNNIGSVSLVAHYDSKLRKIETSAFERSPRRANPSWRGLRSKRAHSVFGDDDVYLSMTRVMCP